MRPFLLAVRFLLELALLAALVIWGFNLDSGLGLRLVAAIAAPVAFIAIWARWVAPKSEHQLEDPARLVVETILFGLAAVALGLAGYQLAGVTLAVVYLVDRILLMLSGGTGLSV
jgi:hypothetical protein